MKDKFEELVQLELTNQVRGLEKEPQHIKEKYKEVFRSELEKGENITFTGMYKYVDSGLTDKFNLPIYKRKRLFRRVKK